MLAAPPRLVVAGGKGWGGLELGPLIDRFQLRDHVVPTGRIDDATLAALYAGAACLALPSLYEGFGLPLVEAMSYGTPVLTSNIASMPEVAGDAGVLVDPLDVDSIAGGLVRMLGDPALRARLSVNARAQSARFSWERAARETLVVFEEAVSERRERSASRR
jgi:glycosyltransferase involved in cell wall biosynthesis